MSLHKLAILDDYQHVALKMADWSSLASKVSIDVFDDTIPGNKADDLVQRLLPYNIICTMRERTPFPAALLDRLPNLRLLTTTGPFNAAIDIDAAKARNIVVCGTLGTGNSTTEHTWALLLALARRIPHSHSDLRERRGNWQNGPLPVGLMGKTLGLVGLGRLGSNVALIAHAFGMRVVAWSPHLTAERVDALPSPVALAASLSELLEQSDVVSVHLVLSATTRKIISAEALNCMKPTALFVNTSRGGLVDESALVDALVNERIAGAALDVFEEEPLPLDHPLRDLENVVLCPHLGYADEEQYRIFYGETVKNVEAFLGGNPTRVIPFFKF